MRRLITILSVLICGTVIISCSKSTPGQPGSSGPAISNLIFSPDTVFLTAAGTYTINGTISFANAAEGVSEFMLTTSAGGSISVPVPSNTANNGQLTGTFQVTIKAAGNYSFVVWIIDGKGNSSNKLTGYLEVMVDASATSWRGVGGLPGSWILYRVQWAHNQFIGVGSAGLIITSPDGEHWVQQNSGTTNTLYGVIWSGALYVAVGNNKTILTSPDAINWTTQWSDNSGISLSGVACSGTDFAAVGSKPGNQEIDILHSTDGMNWTTTYSASWGALNSVRWTGSQYIAVGSAVFTSANGTDWTKRTDASALGSGDLYDVCFSGSAYVAVGSSVTASSADGIHWTGNPTNWYSGGITWSGSVFAAASTLGIMVSYDGVNWTQTYSSNPLSSITWSGMQFVAVGYITPTILVSP